jgi:putative addiction module component (TIGR02574 family)
MVNTAILSQVKSLSAADKLELIGAVWETLSPQDAPVTEEEKRLIDSRLEEMKTAPGDQSSWVEAAARLRHQLR